MVWNAPKTWANGELVTANDLNTHLRDNLAYLKSALVYDSVDADNDYTANNTASFADVDAANLSLTVTTRGKLAVVGFEAAVRRTNEAQAVALDISVDGARLGTADLGLAVVGVQSSRDATVPTPVQAQHWLTDLPAGPHTFRLMWRQRNGTTINGHIDSSLADGMPTRLWLLEFDI